ncbi:VUT family protein [Legionella septentrionalis]|uniref:VUT family protein n=1 Tax=Legionella septentrionalis TaxID=2498109 RepID=A0A433JH99_9GAMM|nr:VUT family protein [Legionella septentrionalis]RUQ81717.1 VUT family protein [Legionella septentrionalis]RUR11380.1 VUT family protein [Legionella septentrionalis]
MSNPRSKSKIPLQFKVFHTLLGFAVFFSLVTLPAETQLIKVGGILTTSELLWWPVVFFIFQLIYTVYGFAYLRHAVYLVILFHTIYILFLRLAICLPSSSFWKMQEIYAQVLYRDFSYLLKSAFFLWICALFLIKLFAKANKEFERYIFLMALIIFTFLNLFWLNSKSNVNSSQILVSILIFYFLNIFLNKLLIIILRIEHVTYAQETQKQLFKFQLPKNINSYEEMFKYHHILFCFSIVFFITSKTISAKFISIGFLTINVGGVVFSLVYLTADMMTDVYGIERTKQMILFVIFCNLLFIFFIWITNLLALNDKGEFQLILHNQTRMFIASAIAFFLGMTINSTAISIIKWRQRKRGISLKKEFLTTVWARIATSTAFGIIIDVSFFSLVAFYGIVPNEKLTSIIIFEDIYKISYEFLLAPVSILLIYLLKVKEKVDIYDELNNLNPFRINTNYKMGANKFYENYVSYRNETDE